MRGGNASTVLKGKKIAFSVSSTEQNFNEKIKILTQKIFIFSQIDSLRTFLFKTNHLICELLILVSIPPFELAEYYEHKNVKNQSTEKDSIGENKKK